METGKFYFIKECYFEKFKDYGIMDNKEERHRRPCFYCFEQDNIYWMIPISSQVDKYKRIKAKKELKYPSYDGIRFGYVNGRQSTFLIQNMCPVTDKYIDCIYTIEKGTVDVSVNEKTIHELNKLARKMIRLHQRGISSTLTDITYILANL